MDASAVIALVSVIATVLLAIAGGTFKHLLGKITTAEAKVTAAEARANTAEALADSKSDTIQELRRQIQRMEISAEITDRLMKQLPPRAPEYRPYREIE